MSDKTQFTARQLAEKLLKCPPDALVFTQGCDCYGQPSRVVLDPSDGRVIICELEDVKDSDCTHSYIYASNMNGDVRALCELCGRSFQYAKAGAVINADCN